MSVMRVAIAGTGGLARVIARCVQTNTSHHIIFLSRNEQPTLADSGFQVAIVDYNDSQTLQFALRGVDTVISTVTGPRQIELIKAAAFVRVRRFAPAEFEGPPQLASANDPLAHHRAIARQWLDYFAQDMQSTVFACGILYERFLPEGLRSIGISSTGVIREGAYILDWRAMTAQAPVYDANDAPTVTICMTAMSDLARFVTRALDMRAAWPPEMRMYSQRIQVRELLSLVQSLRGEEWKFMVESGRRPADEAAEQEFQVYFHSPVTLDADMQVAIAQQDIPRQLRTRALLNTVEGCYDYTHPNANQLFRDVRTTTFQSWFALNCAPLQ